MKILLTGSTGLIGSRFVELLQNEHEIIPLSLTNGVDIARKESIVSYLEGKNFDVVIHLAGKTDVDGCEVDKKSDLELLGKSEQELMDLNLDNLDLKKWEDIKSAVAINSIGTKNLYDVTKNENVKFIYISTDFVFSGFDDYYDESSRPHPVDWYGMSKYLGERAINTHSDLIVRIAFPYGFPSDAKKDLVWKLHDLLVNKEEVSIVSDQIITPTFIDDIVLGLNFLLHNNTIGIINLVGTQSLSPKEIAVKLKENFNLATTINSTALNDQYKGKAPRPARSIMRSDKLKELGFSTKSFDEGLALISGK